MPLRLIDIRVSSFVLRHLLMSLLIDGYNLLHATDLCGDEDFGEKGDQLSKQARAGAFQRSREALLAFLEASLNETERSETTIVFDAAAAPPGLPATYLVGDMTVLFARDYPDADTLIEELIEDHPGPRGLLVVSSDHRVQRAARRRGAKRVDSELWYTQLWQRRIELRRNQQKSIPEKPIGQLSAAEVAYWVEQFDGDDVPELPAPTKDATGEATQTFENPFPPGYAEDLFEDGDG